MPGARPVFAPAKINLYLKVLGRRPDGYHELDSLMARLKLADRLELALGGAHDALCAVTAPPGSLPLDFEGPGNLMLAAAKAFRAAAGGWPPDGLEIRIEKNIPLGAGLGGGSSDCAAVLGFLNGLAPEPLSGAALLNLALSLGADVPFFLSGRILARARGKGEILSEAPPAFQPWAGREILLFNPGIFLSTGRVFEILGLTNPPPDNTLEPMSFSAPGDNDLLAPAARLAPILTAAAESIKGLSPGAWGLSGSGATFWLLSEQPNRDAAELLAAFPGAWIRKTAIMAKGA